MDEDYEHWQNEADCALYYTNEKDLWYADEKSTQASVATSICFQCPVRLECLKAACDTKEPHGVWGGLPASVRMGRGRAHNFLRLVGLPDPYETEDRASPFHISNLGDSDNERQQ
jgi:hypothetical protein